MSNSLFHLQPLVLYRKLLALFDAALQWELSQQDLPELNVENISAPIFVPRLTRGQVYAFVCGGRPMENNPRTSSGFRRQVYDRYWDVLASITQETAILARQYSFTDQLDMWLMGTHQDIAFAKHRLDLIGKTLAAIEDLKAEAQSLLDCLDNSVDTLYELGVDFVRPVVQHIQFQSNLILFEKIS